MRDLAEPPHVVRWVDDERLLVSGADSAAMPPRLREKTIVQRTGQLMYELSTIYPDISGILPGVRLGSAVRAARPTACPTSDRTATSRIISSRSATRATA